MSEFCITLICPAAIEEQLLNLLLLSPNIAVFTSTNTSAHGVAHHTLDDTEQVLGRARAVQVQALVSENEKQALLQALRAEFAGTGLRYWVSAVTESGEAL